MRLFPFYSDQRRIIETIVATPSPWGIPLAVGVGGKTDQGAALLSIIAESPSTWIRTAVSIDKQELELLHLQRLATDCRLATGVEIYDAVFPVPPGQDPPDLHSQKGDEKVGWELTVLSDGKRRLAYALFAEVNRRLVFQQRHRISHLAGYHVNMWFGLANDRAGLPFKSTNEAGYDQIIEALVAHRPDPNQFAASNGTIPQQLEDFGPVQTVEQVSFTSAPLLNGVADSPLYAMTGLTTGLAFQSDHVASEEWESVQNIVQRKDKPANNRLLISVGAPDASGRCLPSEEMLAEFLIANPEPVTATHLSSVIVHFWSTGKAVEILGDSPLELWPPIYQGRVPSWHPFNSLAQ
ncbi:hypothetical protein [Streptacidiphilus sp. EB103A]|uniref:hypothetical protein n=1 Tax=Streptacidiphilus sp. EB103A TaxID=3156275 RepID=UPI00351117CE